MEPEMMDLRGEAAVGIVGKVQRRPDWAQELKPALPPWGPNNWPAVPTFAAELPFEG